MHKNLLQFEWNGVGKLEVLLHGNDAAALRFTPEKEVVEEAIAKTAKSRTRGEDTEGYNSSKDM